jgi:D-glycero-D-manno-heptose 1,7-bisphosphate phosphatase
MKKIVFLDRDGTISKEYPDEEWRYIKEPILLENNIEGLKMIRDLGYEMIILTNQNLIADKIITYEQYEDYSNKLIKILNDNGINILKTYYCPHNDLDNCNCKKPKTGMIDNSLKDFDIDLNNSFYVGDSYSDYKLANKFNLKFYGIKGQNNDEIFKYSDLLDVASNLNKGE